MASMNDLRKSSLYATIGVGCYIRTVADIDRDIDESCGTQNLKKFGTAR